MATGALEKLNSFFAKYKLLKYQKDETIIRADDEPMGVYFVKSGFVRMGADTISGRELTFNIFKPGSFFPMIWAIGEVKNWYFYQSLSQVEVLRAPKNEVVNFLKQNPEVLFDLTRRILIGMDGLIVNIEHLLSGNSYSRVAAAFVLLAKRFGIKSAGKILINVELTHQDIAYLAGVARETVSIAIKQLEDKGVISKIKKNFVVSNIELLEKEIAVEESEEELETPVAI